MVLTTIQDRSLREHPAATTARLKELGVWSEAVRLLRTTKARVTRKLTKKGKALNLQTRIEVCWEGWSSVHEAFPPPEGAEPLTSVAAYVRSTHGPQGRNPDAPPPLDLFAEKRFIEIGEMDDLVGDVLWAYHHVDNANVDPHSCPSPSSPMPARIATSSTGST